MKQRYYWDCLFIVHMQDGTRKYMVVTQATSVPRATPLYDGLHKHARYLTKKTGLVYRLFGIHKSGSIDEFVERITAEGEIV